MRDITNIVTIDLPKIIEKKKKKFDVTQSIKRGNYAGTVASVNNFVG